MVRIVLALDEAILLGMRRWRPAGVVPAGPAFVALAFAIALSRVYLGAHYPLDVAIGACIGLLCGGATRVLL